MRYGWFKIPGLQDGDRSIEEQITAVLPALAEARGRSVLDVGCAEGLIGLEFARAGARSVHGLEALAAHLEVARHVCRGQPMTFECVDLNEPRPVVKHDIVLVLGIIHKLHDPELGLRWAAACTGRLLLIRSGRGERAPGLIYSKHRKGKFVDRDAVLTECGLRHEKTVEGAPERLEDVQYWRRG